MQTRQPPALAQAADALSGQLRAHLNRLAGLLRKGNGALEREYLRGLRKSRFDARQQKALAAITSGAAARILAARRPLAEFIEQVEYNGRRLAKLGVAPARIVRAMRLYDRLAARSFAGLPARESANLKWALGQLRFCVLLTLNNAFYQVREEETQAYQELFRAELESRRLEELLVRLLGVLAGFSRAQAGEVFLFDAAARCWRLRAALPADEAAAGLEVPHTPARLRRLARACSVTGASGVRQVALNPRWPGRYRSCWSVPMAGEQATAGVFQFAFLASYEWLPREQELLSAAVERCLQATRKARMAEDLAAREQQVLTLAERMVEVEERERRRISSELHDEAGQSLLAIRLQLEMLERTAPEASDLQQAIGATRALVERTIGEIRRLIADLSPAVLAHLGLAAAMRQLVARFRRFHQARITLHVGRLGPLPKKLEHVLYRLAQECLNNVARHSQATRVIISLDSADGRLRLRVEDNGVGFDVEEARVRPESFGLAGMRERVALFGGKIHVDSRPKQGTKIRIELPIR